MDAAAIVSGVSSLQGGVLGLAAANRTNSTNQNIATDNRIWQTDENERARNWQERMWQIERAYNTPAAQMERFREAGINPFYGSKIGEGNTSSPSSPPMQSAPTPPHIVTPDYSFVGNSISRTLDYMLKKQEIDANSANQQAQAIKSVGEAAKYLYEAFGSERAQKMIQPLFAQVAGANMDSSIMARGAVAELRKKECESSIAGVEERIANDLGYDKARRELWNMDYEYQRMVAQVGLWSSIAKLNDSNVRLNSAKYDTELAQQGELIARAYKEWSESEYVQSLKLTEDEKRQWFVGNLQLDFLNNFYNVDDRQADWAFDTQVREAKRSEEYQSVQGNRFGIDNNNSSVIYDKFTKMAHQAVQGGFRSSKVDVNSRSNVNSRSDSRVEHHDPARAAEKRDYDFVKHRARRATYSGHEDIEWYEPR